MMSRIADEDANTTFSISCSANNISSHQNHSETNMSPPARHSEKSIKSSRYTTSIAGHLLVVGDVFIAGDSRHPFLANHVACDFRGWHDLSATSMTVSEYLQLIREIRLNHGDR